MVLQSELNNEKEEMVKWFVKRICNFTTSKTSLAQKMLVEFKLNR